MRNNSVECFHSLVSLVHGELLVLSSLDQVIQFQLFLYYLPLGFCLDGVERLLRLSCCIGCLPHIPELHGKKGDTCGYQSEDVGLSGGIEGCHCRLGLTQLKGQPVESHLCHVNQYVARSENHVPCLMDEDDSLGHCQMQLFGINHGKLGCLEGCIGYHQGEDGFPVLHQPGDEVDDSHLGLGKEVFIGFRERQKLLSQASLGILPFGCLPGSLVGCTDVGVTCLGKLGIYYLGYSLHEVARLLGLL